MNSAEESNMNAGWLEAFPQLRVITDTAWLEAVQGAQEMTLPSGAVVVHEGDPCRNFMLVVEGTIRIYQTTESGRELTLYRTCGGDVCILTLGNLLEGTEYSANAITEEEVRVVVIPAQYFEAAMGLSPTFRSFILSVLSRRLRDMMCLVEQVAFQRLDLRLACLLGQLFGQRNATLLSITHDQLALELGSTRVVTSRLLKEFERMGCIRLHRGQIELISLDALARLSGA